MLIGLIVVLGAIALVHAMRVDKRLDAVPPLLSSAERSAEDGRLSAALLDVASAEQILTSANSALHTSPDFELASILPFARQNIDAVRSAVGLGLQLVGGGEQVLANAAPLASPDGHLEISVKDGQVPLSAAVAVQSAIAQTLGALPPRLHPPHSSLLIGPVRRAVDRVYSQVSLREAQLTSVGNAIHLVDDIAGAAGDRRYLIAVANSAEMRGSGGMILSYGVLTSHASKVSLGAFGPIDELKLTSPETTVGFPADFTASFGDLKPTELWREANIMTDFTVDAPVLEAMFTKATGLPVDGVIQVDSAGLGAILAGIGPVGTPDLGTLTAANAVPVTLSESYALYPNRQARQDFTGEAATAVFTKLANGTFASLRSLGSALLRAGQQRHVMMYANDPTDEAIISSFGFGGGLPPPHSAFVQLAVENFGATKLDYYLYSSLSLAGQPPSPYGSHLSATIELANAAPRGQSFPQEVFGPNVAGAVAGEYNGLVILYLPAGTYLVGSQTDASVTSKPALGSQNGVATVTYTVSIPAGGTSKVVLNLFAPPLPVGTAGFSFVPQPRVIPTVFAEKL